MPEKVSEFESRGSQEDGNGRAIVPMARQKGNGLDIKVNVTEGEGGKRTLEVEVPTATVEARLQAAYVNYSKTLNLPGFRKGKIPLSIVKSRFGKVIEGEVLNDLIPEFYDQAWRTSGIEPISQPVIDDVDYVSGEPLRFKASLEVKPNIEVRNYTGLRATRPLYPVRDSDAERQIRTLRERSAEDHSVERPVQLGDLVVVDLQELDASGVPILGRRYENRTLLVGGERTFSHDFDNQMLGVSKGEERRVRFTYNRDLPDSDLAGKEMFFSVAVKDIRERILPALDDEFAKDHGAENLKALEDRIREGLKAQADYVARRRLETSLLSALIQENPIDPPEAMVENALNAIVEDHKKEHEGHDHPIDEDQIREQSRDLAAYQARTHLLLEAVAQKEGVTASDEEVDERIRRMAEANQQTFETVKRLLQRNRQIESIRENLVTEKTLQFLIDRAQIDEVEEVPEGERRIITP
ncbi:MAG: trigger factor [Candidatus Latescibacteria bacterium]|nr:trigger factor [Candidatus Latescibacterota bacterium]